MLSYYRLLQSRAWLLYVMSDDLAIGPKCGLMETDLESLLAKIGAWKTEIQTHYFWSDVEVSTPEECSWGVQKV